MPRALQLIERGWVDGDRWRFLIDRVKAGAPDMSISFIAAINAELWLQTQTGKDVCEFGAQPDLSQI